MSRRKRFTRNLGRTLPSPLPARRTRVWVRFEHDSEPYGVFSYVDDALAVLEDHECRELDALTDWFNAHLAIPRGMTTERCWFGSEAAEYVARARKLARVVRSAGIPIVERRTRRVPGRVRWKDDHQFVVFTYRDAPRPRKLPREE